MYYAISRTIRQRALNNGLKFKVPKRALICPSFFSLTQNNQNKTIQFKEQLHIFHKPLVTVVILFKYLIDVSCKKDNPLPNERQNVKYFWHME